MTTSRRATGVSVDIWLMSLTYKLRDLLLPRTEILKEVGIREGYFVLDFGCGPGSYVLPLSRMVGEQGRVYALDRNPFAVDAVNRLVLKKQLPNVETILSDCHTGLASESIDAVLLYDVVHHLEARYNVLSELHRVLKDTGVLSVGDHHLKRDDIIRMVGEGGLFELAFEGRRTHNFRKSDLNGGKH